MTPLRAQTPTPEGEIVFWHHYADETRADFWQTMADEFNAAHPENMPVRAEFFPSYDHQHDAILSALLNGNPPDVAFVQNYHARLYQLSDALVDLSPLLMEADMRDEQYLGFPLTRSATALYVNMDALTAYGLDDAPVTRADFALATCAFHEGRGWGDVRLVAPPGFDFPRDASFLMALGPHEIVEDDAFDFDTDHWHNTFNFLLDLQSRGCMSTHITTRAEMQNRFASGQTLFYIDSSSARPFVEAAIADYFAEPFALEVLPIPSDLSGPVSLWSGPSLSIFRSSPEKEAAVWEWVRWLAQPEQVARWAEVNHAFPTRNDVDYSPEYEPFVNAEWMGEPNFAGYDLIRDEIIFAALDIFAGESPSARLQSLTETANQIKDAFQSP